MIVLDANVVIGFLDANVVIGFLDATNAQHARAVKLLGRFEGEPFVMHEITVAEVLAGPAWPTAGLGSGSGRAWCRWASGGPDG
ncbi:type II toxin-antitoxin system VapC family toxin [Flexivirga caeni]|uniref:Type II toxin-antitoxin system VapC family toxin n=1 Tax=Flexivirga caeni TaxID=2294115 RepID=A0A3M9M6I1_9MICO|nr:type II toxin-antitoxin system VapC family toxin [Flexivirga caeni]RNI21171.1 type II toxin-antitoxin system VapC family toxin [Flexivirga caeni]